MKPQFRLFDAFVMATVFAILLVLYTQFSEWRYIDEQSPVFRRARQIFSLNVLLLTTLTVVAFLGRTARRTFAIGYAAFGWVYLVTVLKGFCFLESSLQLWILGKASLMGILIGILAGFATYYLLPREKSA